MDGERRIELFNHGAETIFGYKAEEVIGQPIDMLLPRRFHSAHGGQVENFMGEAVASRSMSQRGEVVGLRKNGEEFPALASISKSRRGGGMVLTAMLRDVTELKDAERRLRQAQKMEAVGQLTGGVAHDFNNLLAVIQGNAEFLADEVGQDNPMTQAILRATTRGSELTQRLLAFSRQQPLRPQAVDLAALVGGVSVLLARTLGETITIETVTAPGLWVVSADPGQVENALLNLAINARDAMPDGGRLTIECQNTALDEAYVTSNPEALAGEYSVLAVMDTGTGMSAEVQAHAFEPFFTTKEVGKGSGLGLSMIYGFAKQSGGHIAIYSEEGMGTTVKLYLPRAEGPPDAVADQSGNDVPRGRGETILVIEDDTDVRALAASMLEELGYKAVAVADGDSGLAALARAPVDVVLSDVILPGGMSGPEFAEAAQARHGGIKIVFMSGYPSEAARHNGFVDSDTVLLTKPFERGQLAYALRRMLDRSPPG